MQTPIHSPPLQSVPTPATQGSKAPSQAPVTRSPGGWRQRQGVAATPSHGGSWRDGNEGKEGLRQVGPWVKREEGGEKTGLERREGQRQVGPHVKGAGAGSYYLLGSRCPPVSPGSAGSSVTEHRRAALEQARRHPKVRQCSRDTAHCSLHGRRHPRPQHPRATNVRVSTKAPPPRLPSAVPRTPLISGGCLRTEDPGVSPASRERLLLTAMSVHPGHSWLCRTGLWLKLTPA